ncbi:carbonic anhydrase [Anaplasma phagocytophilum str. HZ2]|nr:carbonic anhydrase [Anaplasma phagocytophilum str. HZ2]AGR80318.1 carbonic anhydrase [Anaplasma phagocytophilum str. JM]AGR81572.1 carbonic anhydrase [Anaplasma phagocytophilum str. Dog2]EOA62647.1 hexapeptide transferase family protein [Anaplasma phagocytophilum str. CRT38]
MLCRLKNTGGCEVMREVLVPYAGVSPSVDSTAFIAGNARIIGDVCIGKNASIWYGTVLRGDVDKIEVGEGTNIQDNTVVHTDSMHGDTVIGKFVTIGHSCILHACTLGNNAFVGMGSIVMDRAVMEEGSMLAAGSLLTRGKIVKSGELWAGRPAKFLRMMTEEEILYLQKSAENYIALSRGYL